jgi:hypothetical protein
VISRLSSGTGAARSYCTSVRAREGARWVASAEREGKEKEGRDADARAEAVAGAGSFVIGVWRRAGRPGAEPTARLVPRRRDRRRHGGAANLCRNHETCLRRVRWYGIPGQAKRAGSARQARRDEVRRDILRRRPRAGTTKATRHAVGPGRRVQRRSSRTARPVVIGRRWTRVRAPEMKAPAVRLNGRFE